MMKFVFLLVLLVLGGAGGLLGMNVATRWVDNMTQTPRVMPGERIFAMPSGSIPRRGGELTYPKEEREAAAARKNPVAATPDSVKTGGELFTVYCTPCHGSSGKGDGLVSAKFVPPADLTNADLQKGRSDGYWQSYLSVGGAVMPSYAEALTAEERWHVVN
ncbi:MAG TPA: cytochrome c, partial [Candidatus Limnocylindrales bacterium]|nr:cytochrome c [Candidatus Limnocylindrales bacterium]